MRDFNFGLPLPHIIAHRGASLFAPENTLAAMQLAKELGAEWVEFDVMMTKDAKLVCLHDRHLQRIFGLDRYVDECSYQELCQLDAGGWFGQEFTEEKIPSFKDMLLLLGQLDLGINIEIKSVPTPTHLQNTVESVLQELNAYWTESLSRVLVTSFDYSALLQVHQSIPEIHTGLLLREWEDSWEKNADGIEADTVHLSKQAVTLERIQEVKTSGRKFLTYTVNDLEEAERLFALGVDAIFSDNPTLVTPLAS